MRQKILEIISIQEAMDNLAAIASINMESPPPIGLIGEGRIVTGAEEAKSDEIRWLAAEGPDVLLRAIDMTYRSVYRYLKNLSEMDWEKEKEGVSAMMSLVGESAHKIDVYFAFRFDQELPKVAKRTSFCELQEFYVHEFSRDVEGKRAWESTWQEEKSQLKGGVSELRDFEALLKDKEYELFYIFDERGKPFLSERLLRNVKLTADFDVETGSFEEDPFLQVKAMQDRDFQACASQILDACSEEISLLYSFKKRVFEFTCAKQLSQAIIALYLAANSRNLAQRTVGKTCSQYFMIFSSF